MIKVLPGGIASIWLDIRPLVDTAGNAFVDVVNRTAELGNLFAPFRLSSFGEGAFGALYVLGRDSDAYRIAAAVPEPGVLAMLLGGLGLVAVAARRRRAPDPVIRSA